MLLEGADGALDDAVRIVRFGPLVVLGGGETEEKDGVDAERAQFVGLAGELIEREVVLAGHRGDLFADVVTVRDEDGIYEVSGIEAGLPDEGAEAVTGAEAAEALEGCRECAGCGGHVSSLRLQRERDVVTPLAPSRASSPTVRTG